MAFRGGGRRGGRGREAGGPRLPSHARHRVCWLRRGSFASAETRPGTRSSGRFVEAGWRRPPASTPGSLGPHSHHRTAPRPRGLPSGERPFRLPRPAGTSPCLQHGAGAPCCDDFPEGAASEGRQERSPREASRPAGQGRQHPRPRGDRAPGLLGALPARGGGAGGEARDRAPGETHPLGREPLRSLRLPTYRAMGGRPSTSAPPSSSSRSSTGNSASSWRSGPDRDPGPPRNG